MNRKYLIKLNDATVNGKPIGIYVESSVTEFVIHWVVFCVYRPAAKKFTFDEAKKFIDSVENPKMYTMEFESIGHPEVID